MVKQNEKTIQFWDNFYTEQPNKDNKEWILHPSRLIFQYLWDRLPSGSSTCSSSSANSSLINILEIGCGTSTLSRDFYQYCRKRAGSVNGDITSCTSPSSQRKIHICATDVSEVCIQLCRERDQEFLPTLSSPAAAEEGISYRVLNIAEPEDIPKDEENAFDMILDKGCLDTFLFRSRQRGPQKDQLPLAVLNNIHRLLKHDSGVYAIITPRSKFFAVRDYPGFSQVHRMPLDVKSLQGELAKAELVNQQDGPKTKQNGKIKEEVLYLYTCYKGNSSKDVPTTDANNIVVKADIPADESICPKCSMTFLKYRKGEDMEGRGRKFWVRHWKGHTVHCKGNNEDLIA